MKKIIIISTLILFGVLFAQNPESEDGIGDADPKEIPSIYYELAEKTLEVNPQASLKYADKGLFRAQSNKDEEGAAKNRIMQGAALLKMGNYKQSLEALEKPPIIIAKSTILKRLFGYKILLEKIT